MVLVARCYYQRNMSQVTIAKELGLSRPTVSRLLKRAVEEKIVRIEIVDPYQEDAELAHTLCGELKLSNALVISGGSAATDIIRHNVAYAAANYLENSIESGDVVGLGWGRTMKDLAEYIKPKRISGAVFVPLLGGVGRVDASYQSYSIAESVSRSFQGKWLQLHAPAMVENKSLKEGILELPDAREVVQCWGRLTKAIIGIGESPFEGQFLFYDYVGEMERIQLSERGAVGDVCTRFFDIQGRPIDYLQQECIAVELDMLKAVGTVIAVAGGKQKARAIIGASRGRYISSLITDESTAREILDLLGN